MVLPLPISFGQASAGHAFAEATLFEEVLFQAADLFVQQVVGHFDQADDDVRAGLRVGVLDAFAEGVVGGVGLAVEIAEALCMGVVAGPFLQAVSPEEIAVVGEEFFETGACDVGQLEFCLLGSPRRLGCLR